MSLSVLIPSYNYSAFPLAEELSSLAKQLDTVCEIIVMDDASTDDRCREKNNAINLLPHCRSIMLDENVGRARIRNLLAESANGEWLLFLDCDAKVISDTFLYNYVKASENAPVVCGGLIHPESLPSPNVCLRYKYEKAADKLRSANERSKHPYGKFTTFSFLIRRELFLQIRFNEQCTDYGYEDTLFGEKLKERNIHILHIDNPLMHTGLEENKIFLKKTEVAIKTLIRLQNNGENFDSRLIKQYSRLQRLGLAPVIRLFFHLFSPLMRSNLLGKSPNLTLFSIYKMGYYSVELRKGKI